MFPVISFFLVRRVSPAATIRRPYVAKDTQPHLPILSTINLLTKIICSFHFFIENNHGNNSGSAKALSQLL